MREWRELHWSTVDEQHIIGLLTTLAADPVRGGLVWEVRAEAGRTRYFFGAEPSDLAAVTATMGRLLPELIVTQPSERGTVERAGRLQVRGRHLGLALDARPEVLRAVLAALSGASKEGDVLVLQVVLGRALAPEILPADAADPTASVASLLFSGVRAASASLRTRMQAKLGQYRFRAVVRVGVSAASPARRRLLVHQLLAALRTLQSSGIQITLTSKNPVNLDAGQIPFRQPLRLTPEELLPLLAWPMGSADLPGLPPRHPQLLAPPKNYPPATSRIFATSTAPGTHLPVGIAMRDGLRHTHLYGPTGAGKSNLLLHLIAADIRDGRSVVVIDPKRDLAMDALRLIPENRTGQVAVIDPLLDRPAGINPFAGFTPGENEDRRGLVAEIMLDLFKGLFPNAFGPETADTLHASFLTLTYAEDASLARLPQLLTDQRYRREIITRIADPMLLDFWAAYDQKTPGQQANAVGPALRRLRQFLLRAGVRRVLDQPEPTFDLRDVFASPRILVVSLNRGLLGTQTAALLGSLVVAQLWQLILARAALAAGQRTPVSIYVDEAQNFLHLGDLAEALEQSRSLGVAWHLAHQHRPQMPDRLLKAIDANARNKIIFGLEDEEAKTAARYTGLDPDDFSQLPPYEIYLNLQHQGRRTGWFSARVLPPPKAISSAEDVIAEAEARYGTHPAARTAKADKPARTLRSDEDEPIGRQKRDPS